jgi:hypothetical protein
MSIRFSTLSEASVLQFEVPWDMRKAACAHTQSLPLPGNFTAGQHAHLNEAQGAVRDAHGLRKGRRNEEVLRGKLCGRKKRQHRQRHPPSQAPVHYLDCMPVPCTASMGFVTLLSPHVHKACREQLPPQWPQTALAPPATPIAAGSHSLEFAGALREAGLVRDVIPCICNTAQRHRQPYHPPQPSCTIFGSCRCPAG